MDDRIDTDPAPNESFKSEPAYSVTKTTLVDCDEHHPADYKASAIKKSNAEISEDSNYSHYEHTVESCTESEEQDCKGICSLSQLTSNVLSSEKEMFNFKKECIQNETSVERNENNNLVNNENIVFEGTNIENFQGRELTNYIKTDDLHMKFCFDNDVDKEQRNDGNTQNLPSGLTHREYKQNKMEYLEVQDIISFPNIQQIGNNQKIPKEVKTIQEKNSTEMSTLLTLRDPSIHMLGVTNENLDSFENISSKIGDYENMYDAKRLPPSRSEVFSLTCNPLLRSKHCLRTLRKSVSDSCLTEKRPNVSLTEFDNEGNDKAICEIESLKNINSKRRDIEPGSHVLDLTTKDIIEFGSQATGSSIASQESILTTFNAHVKRSTAQIQTTATGSLIFDKADEADIEKSYFLDDTLSTADDNVCEDSSTRDNNVEITPELANQKTNVDMESEQMRVADRDVLTDTDTLFIYDDLDFHNDSRVRKISAEIVNNVYQNIQASNKSLIDDQKDFDIFSEIRNIIIDIAEDIPDICEKYKGIAEKRYKKYQNIVHGKPLGMMCGLNEFDTDLSENDQDDNPDLFEHLNAENSTLSLIRIRVGAVRYEIRQETFRLIEHVVRAHAHVMVCNKSGREEYLLYRDASAFNSVLGLHCGGQLHMPMDLCPTLFRRELQFWGVSEDLLEPCCAQRLQALTYDDGPHPLPGPHAPYDPSDPGAGGQGWSWRRMLLSLYLLLLAMLLTPALLRLLVKGLQSLVDAWGSSNSNNHHSSNNKHVHGNAKINMSRNVYSM